MNWAQLLGKYKRVAICGGPRSGKTTLSFSIDPGRPTVHTDDYMGLDWADVPAAVIGRLTDESTFLVEGVQVARCLRKGLGVDAVVWCGDEHAPITPKQRQMGRGVRSVFDEVVFTRLERVPVFFHRGGVFNGR